MTLRATRALATVRALARLGAAGAIATACGSSASAEQISNGEAVFVSPLSGGNTFSCQTCHALTEPAEDGFRRPGHSFEGVLDRPSYKNGRLERFIDAANSCRNDWMGLAEPWSEGDPDYAALVDFLARSTQGSSAESPAAASSAAASPALAFTIAEAPAAGALQAGDADNGKALFNQTCAICHGRDAVGSERGPLLLGSRLTLETVTGRVRRSGPTESDAYTGLNGGRMPFWSAERLSDVELADITAFVVSNDPAPLSEQEQSAQREQVRQCAPTHPRVGQTAILSGRNQVGGTATIVDDCTIVIEQFTFDGSGIDVRIYGGLDGDYDAGFGMLGQNLVSSAGHFGDTLTVQLPPGRTLDEMNGISVWCIPIRTSFGEGAFE